MAGPSLVQGDEAAVYADKGYDSQRFRDALAEAGIKDGIMHKARRNHPLKDWQKWLNKVVSPIRSSVERGFATIKHHYAYRRVRYLGLAAQPLPPQLDVRRHQPAPRRGAEAQPIRPKIRPSHHLRRYAKVQYVPVVS